MTETVTSEPTAKELGACIMMMASACYSKIEKGKRAEKVIAELKNQNQKLQLSVAALIKENTKLKEPLAVGMVGGEPKQLTAEIEDDV